MKDIPSNYIAVNLKFLRRRFGYTQSHLARELHLSRSSYGALESGLRSPRADLLSDLSHIYLLPIDTILEKDQKCFLKETGIAEDTCEKDSDAGKLLRICVKLSPFSLGRLFEAAENLARENPPEES